MKATLREVAKGFPKEARRGAKVVAEELLLLPAQERAPKKSGRLAGSGKVSVSIRKAGANPNILATVKFGGPDVPYATLQHETHKTQSKFLEIPLREAVPTAGPALSREISVERSVGAQ
jgi:hypothetical protein